MPAHRQSGVSLILSHARNTHVTPTRSASSSGNRIASHLKGTTPARSLPPFHSPNSNSNKSNLRSASEETKAPQSGTVTIISPELANVFASSPVQSAFLLSSNPSLASEFVETFNSSFTQTRTLSEKLALLRKAGTALSPNKKKGRGSRNVCSNGTFRHARGVVEDGGQGLESCVSVFEEKYWANMKGMEKDIETFCKLRMQEFRRSRPLSRLEALELDRVRERFGGERVHGWAFSALKEMALDDDEEDGRPALGELFALMEAEAFVQQVASDQATVGADAALLADLVVGGAVESALLLCADAEVAASRSRVNERLGVMRRIAVDELADANPGAGAELLHVCADLEVRLAGYAEDSEQVMTTKYYAEVLENMDR